MGALASSSNTASADERSATEKAVFFAAIYPFGQLSPKSVDNLVDEPEKYEKTAAKTLLLLNWSEIDHIAKYLLYQQHTAPISDPYHFVYTIFGTASMFLRDCA